MMKTAVWISAGKGIRYKEHPTRKHGKRPDRYWCLQYKLQGKPINEAVGWWSDGASQAQCEDLLAELRQNQKNGQGPQTLREMRATNLDKQNQEALARKLSTHKSRSLGGFMEAEYLPRAKLTLTPRGLLTRNNFLRTWLAPLANMPLAQITTADLTTHILRPMIEAGRSPSTIRHVLSAVSDVWKLGMELGVVAGENPVTKVKKPKIDNQRDRFFTKAEAGALLASLKEKSLLAHDTALLSLFSGLRIGECLSLTWADINLEEGRIFVKDTKNKRNRHAYITAEIKAMLTGRYQGQPKTEQIFNPKKMRYLYQTVSVCFRQAIDELGLNDGITDRRQKLVIHSLRHTFASWLVQMGKPLYTISRLMGHSSLKMTERYAHLAPETQRAAAMELEGILEKN
jgi:integrase